MRYSILRFAHEHPFQIKNWGPLTQFVDNECDFFNFSNKTPNPETLQLTALSKFKLMDTVSGINSPAGFLLSDKLKTILEQHALPPHRNYPVTILHKQKTYSNFSWMHILFLPDDPAPINFQRTQFFHYENPTTPKPVFVKNFDEAREKNVGLREFSEIELSPEASKFDLLAFRFAPHNYLISEKLKQHLTESKITGIQILDAAITST